MEVLRAPSTFFHSPFFLGYPQDKVALRRRPAASTLFRSPTPPHLPHTPPPQRRGNRSLASPACTAAEAPPTPPEPAEGEAGAILRDFLVNHGMPRNLAEQRAASWNEVVELLSSKLRSLHESEQQLGVELSKSQLLDLFTPYLRSVVKEYRDIEFTGVDEQPHPMAAGRKIQSTFSIMQRKAIAQLETPLSQGCPPTFVLHLMDLDLNLREIRSMVYLYPYVVSVSMEEKLDPLIQFLVSLGMSMSHVPLILRRCPHLLALNITEILMPIVSFLESKGVDKEQWPTIISRCPQVFTYSTTKFEAVVDYFSEMGLSAAAIGRLLTRSPRLLCMSIDAKIKPTVMFFLDNGFTMAEVLHLFEFGCFWALNLERNLKPKWDFFLTMGYSRQALVRFPIYFNFSLEQRIKPRYKRVAELGSHWSLRKWLSPSELDFELLIQRTMQHRRVSNEDA